MSLPVQAMTAKELLFVGSFRFHHEFPRAVEFMQNKRLDVTPLITQTFQMKDAQEAFETASDRTRSVKVHIDFAT